jgi:hypothetical protein
MNINNLSDVVEAIERVAEKAATEALDLENATFKVASLSSSTKNINGVVSGHINLNYSRGTDSSRKIKCHITISSPKINPRQYDVDIDTESAIFRSLFEKYAKADLANKGVFNFKFPASTDAIRDAALELFES